MLQQNKMHMERNSSNQLLVSSAESILEQMKLEIAQQFGVHLGATTTSRENGSVGGEMTKRLVAAGQQIISQQTRTLH